MLRGLARAAGFLQTCLKSGFEFSGAVPDVAGQRTRVGTRKKKGPGVFESNRPRSLIDELGVYSGADDLGVLVTVFKEGAFDPTGQAGRGMVDEIGVAVAV